MSDTTALSIGIIVIVAALIGTTIFLAFQGPGPGTEPPFNDEEGSESATPAPGKLVIGPAMDTNPPPAFPSDPVVGTNGCVQVTDNSCHTKNMRYCFASWIDNLDTSTPAPLISTFLDNRDTTTDSAGNEPSVGDLALYQDINGVPANLDVIIQNATFWVECDRAGRPSDFLANHWPIVTFSDSDIPGVFSVLKLFYLPKNKTIDFWGDTVPSTEIDMSYIATIEDMTNYTNYFDTPTLTLCRTPPPSSSLAFNTSGSLALALVITGLVAVLIGLCYLLYRYRKSRKFVID
jgi:hypothetical protein